MVEELPKCLLQLCSNYFLMTQYHMMNSCNLYQCLIAWTSPLLSPSRTASLSPHLSSLPPPLLPPPLSLCVAVSSAGDAEMEPVSAGLAHAIRLVLKHHPLGVPVKRLPIIFKVVEYDGGGVCMYVQCVCSLGCLVALVRTFHAGWLYMLLSFT